MPNKNIKDYLQENKVKWKTIPHTPWYTAQEIAASAHVAGKRLAKTVIIKLGEELAMVVLPAYEHVNYSQIKEITGESDVDLARESDFKSRFPECEVGAMPPFGNLYDMKVFVSNNLSHDQIAFNSGSHSELMEISYKDFIDLVKPKIITSH